jgi:small GTP-binding protein
VSANKIQICILGAEKAGKTSLLKWCAEEMPSDGKGDGASTDFINKTMSYPFAKKKIQVKIWDSVFKENSIPKKVMKTAMGFIVLTDITDPQWEAKVRQINEKIKEEAQKDVVKYLVANKNDLDRAFTVLEGHKLEVELKFDDYEEISVKHGINVQRLLDQLITKIYFKQQAKT